MNKGALKCPGKGSATGKPQPHKGRKRLRDVLEVGESDAKKPRMRDISSLNMVVKAESVVRDSFSGMDAESDSDGEDGTGLDRSEDIALLYPGLCSKRQAAANKARRAKEAEEGFFQRKSAFDALVEISSSLVDLTVTTVAYNTFKNYPLNGSGSDSRDRDIFEYVTLSLQGDKEYLVWARLGSEYAVVAIKTTAITSVGEIFERRTAGLEIFQEDMPKSYRFLFENQNATDDIQAVLQALSALPRYLSAASEFKTRTRATSATSSTAPAVNAEEARKQTNERETHIMRGVYLKHKNDPEKPYWPGYYVKQLFDFLKARDKFHKIVDTTMWSNASSKLTKRQAQDRIAAYLVAHPTEGAIESTAQQKSKKLKSYGQVG